MALKLPIDFEQKLKLPPPVDGKGYPYQVSAKDLMKNFKFLLGIVPEGTTLNDVLYWSGIAWEVLPAPAATGTFSLTVDDGTIEWGTGAGMPSGVEGDILYHNGTDWVTLAAPSAPSAGTVNVLNHDGSAPTWNTYDEVEVDICISGTPTAYKLLGNPV